MAILRPTVLAAVVLVAMLAHAGIPTTSTTESTTSTTDTTTTESTTTTTESTTTTTESTTTITESTTTTTESTTTTTESTTTTTESTTTTTESTTTTTESTTTTTESTTTTTESTTTTTESTTTTTESTTSTTESTTSTTSTTTSTTETTSTVTSTSSTTETTVTTTSSTATTSSSTTITPTTSTTVVPTTSTTVPPGGEVCTDGVDNDGDDLTDCQDPDCASHPACQGDCTRSADFDSIECRLASLSATIEGTPGIQLVGARLVVPISRAAESESMGRSACASGDLKGGRKRLAQAAKRLQQFMRRMRSGVVRRTIAPDLRTRLAEAGDTIRSDVKTLRSTLDCPADAVASGVTVRGR